MQVFPQGFSFRKLLFLIILFSTGLLNLKAQDPSFSQFYANRMYLNPAFTGLEKGLFLNASSRMQWLAIDKGFRTYDVNISSQIPFAKMGVGLHLHRNVEGFAQLATTSAGLAFSYTIPGKKNNIHFGFETKISEKSIDWDKLTFTDELHPIFGIINQSTAVPVRDQVTFGDVDFGIVWRREGDWSFGRRSFRKVRSMLGISFHHLPYWFSNSAQGNDSFLNRDWSVDPRGTLHGGLLIPFRPVSAGGKQILFSPNFKLDTQGYQLLDRATNIMVGTFGAYALLGNLYLSLFYQNRIFAPNPIHTNSLIFGSGVYIEGARSNSGETPEMFIGISFDLNSTGLGPAAGSIFELQFTYNISKQIFGNGKGFGSRNRNRILDCKSFF